MIRLDKYLANKNICTRSQVTSYIKKNKIVIDGVRINKKNYNIANNTLLYINNEEYSYHEKVYYLINKPKGYICSNKDELYPSVLNLLNKKDYQNDLFTVGRLDVDTTGVLLITNDGDFSHKLLHPKKHVDKTYKVKLKLSITKDEIDHLENGVIINNNYMTKPAKIQYIDSKCIKITISEGKYHQIKEMLKAVNNEVIDLHRESFGEYVINFDDNYIIL